MKTLIIGDSFVSTIKNTYLEDLINYFNLDIVKHEGFIGGCEYYIYEQFTNSIAHTPHNRPKVDLVIFCHTEQQRLANSGYFPINYINAMSGSPSLPSEIREAAKQYYSLLYHEKFHGVVHHLLLKEIQQISSDCRYKQIHIQSFKDRIPMKSGLWFRGGLDSLAKFDYKDYYKDMNLLNHLTEEKNKKLSKWMIPYIEEYLKTEIELQIIDIDIDKIMAG